MDIANFVAVGNVWSHFYISVFCGLLCTDCKVVACAARATFAGAVVANVFSIIVELVYLLKGGYFNRFHRVCFIRLILIC